MVEEYRISASIGVDRTPSWLTFLPYHTFLFPACTNQLPRNEVSLILIVVQFFTLMCHDITHSPYDRNTFPLADHFKPTNSNSLHNSNSFDPHSQSTHHKDFSLSALRISASSDEFHALTDSCHTPTFEAHFSPRAPEFNRNNLQDESTECKRYELVYESKKIYE